MPDDASPSPGTTAAPSDADPGTGGRGIVGSLAFFLGLLAFVGAAVAYVAVLWVGGDVWLPLVVNGVAALVLVASTARDTYADPDSDVTTLPGALGTALLMLGAYALVASTVVALSAPWHGRFDLAIWLGVAAAAAAVFGFFTFPAEVVSGGGDADADDG